MLTPNALRRGLLALCGSLLFSTALTSANAASLEEIKARGYMTIATEDDFAPFEFIKDGKPQGFTHDIVAELKKYAPFEIRQEILPWTGLLAAVSAGKYDTAITGSIVTTERLQTFDFAPPTASATHYAILRAKENRVKTVADLKGLTAGVQAGGAQLARLPELGEMLKKTGGTLGKVVEYPSYPEAYADLANGRLDYVVNSIINAQSLVRERPKVFALGMPVSGAGFHAWPVAKGNESLLGFLTGFVDHIKKSGKLAELQKKWFGQSFASLPGTPIKTAEQFRTLTALPSGAY